MSEHIKKSHNVSLILYHLVCPAKYRRLIFHEMAGVDECLKEVCLEIEKRYDIRFVEIGVDHDHVHFLIQSVPMISPSSLAQTIKSITAREVFRRLPNVRQILWGGEFWTKGYYVNTVSKAGNEEAIQQYVQQQGMEYTQIHRNQLKLFEGI